MAWGQGNKNKKQKANTSWGKEQIAEYLVLNPVPINAEPWSPLTACQFPGIADFVATLRHECCQHGAHFMWPSASIGFQISLTYALHMLGPGHSVSIRNAATPSPHILENYPVDYYHGTSCSALVRGVLRHGLQPSSGAGSEDLRKAFGVPVPLVYTSRRRECAMGYPCADGMTVKMSQVGQFGGGEIIARDGTPPLRVLLRLICPPSWQVWHKKDGSNDQHGFRPSDVFVSHVVFYALPYDCTCPSQRNLTWELRDVRGDSISPKELEERLAMYVGRIEGGGRSPAEATSTGSGRSPAEATGGEVPSPVVGILHPVRNHCDIDLYEENCLALQKRLALVPPLTVVDWVPLPDAETGEQLSLPTTEEDMRHGGETNYGAYVPILQPERRVAATREFQGVPVGVRAVDMVALHQQPALDKATEMAVEKPYDKESKADEVRRTAASGVKPPSTRTPAQEAARQAKRQRQKEDKAKLNTSEELGELRDLRRMGRYIRMASLSHQLTEPAYVWTVAATRRRIPMLHEQLTADFVFDLVPPDHDCFRRPVGTMPGGSGRSSAEPATTATTIADPDDPGPPPGRPSDHSGHGEPPGPPPAPPSGSGRSPAEPASANKRRRTNQRVPSTWAKDYQRKVKDALTWARTLETHFGDTPAQDDQEENTGISEYGSPSSEPPHETSYPAPVRDRKGKGKAGGKSKDKPGGGRFLAKATGKFSGKGKTKAKSNAFNTDGRYGSSAHRGAHGVAVPPPAEDSDAAKTLSDAMPGAKIANVTPMGEEDWAFHGEKGERLLASFLGIEPKEVHAVTEKNPALCHLPSALRNWRSHNMRQANKVAERYRHNKAQKQRTFQVASILRRKTPFVASSKEAGEDGQLAVARKARIEVLNADGSRKEINPGDDDDTESASDAEHDPKAAASGAGDGSSLARDPCLSPTSEGECLKLDPVLKVSLSPSSSDDGGPSHGLSAAPNKEDETRHAVDPNSRFLKWIIDNPFQKT